MTKSFVLSSFILLAPLVANAGNMFGPAPFRDGSPLVTGVDGTYQATARAENVTGIFRFAYSGGSQTANQQQNNWIFFVNGLVQKGNVSANIQDSSIDGIFDTLLGSGSSNALPYITVSVNSLAGGSFQGKLNQKSPNGAFSGKGIFQAITNTIQAFAVNQNVAQVGNGTQTGGLTGGSVNFAFTNRLFPAPIEFNFRGVRTSTSSTAQTNSGAN